MFANSLLHFGDVLIVKTKMIQQLKSNQYMLSAYMQMWMVTSFISFFGSINQVTPYVWWCCYQIVCLRTFSLGMSLCLHCFQKWCALLAVWWTACGLDLDGCISGKKACSHWQFLFTVKCCSVNYLFKSLFRNRLHASVSRQWHNTSDGDVNNRAGNTW